MSESDVVRSPLLVRIGRATAIAAGGVAVALWGLLVSRVDSSVVGPQTRAVAAVMVILAVATILSAWSTRPAGVVGAVALSLVPVGLYLLATPSIYAGIGLANLLGLAGGIAMIVGRSRVSA